VIDKAPHQRQRGLLTREEGWVGVLAEIITGGGLGMLVLVAQASAA